MNKIYTIGDEGIHRVKKEGLYLIEITDEPGGSSTYHGLFSVNEDFPKIITTHQNVGITLWTTREDVTSQNTKESINNKCNKSNNTSNFVETHHTLQRKGQKTAIDYSNNSLNYFCMLAILPYSTLRNQEK